MDTLPVDRVTTVEAVTDVNEASDGTARWAYVRDPEGNVVEITQR
jgi:hypothetical protein